MTRHGANSALDKALAVKRRFAMPQPPQISLTIRLIILVLIAIFPAIVIQGYNEYELRKAREADIRQQVVQITKQFGEEIGELREGARQLLFALAQLTPVKLRETEACDALFTALKSQYANYSLLAGRTQRAGYFARVRPQIIPRWRINRSSSEQWLETGSPSAITGPIPPPVSG